MFENISENRNVVLGIKLNKFEVNYLMDLLYFYKLTDKLTIVDLNNSNRLISWLCLLYGLESSIGSMELLKYQPFSEDVEKVNYSTQVVESLGGVTSVLIFNEDKGIIEEYRRVKGIGIWTFKDVEYLNFAVSKEELPTSEKALRFALNIESRFLVIKFKIGSLLTRVRVLDLLYQKFEFLKVKDLKVLKAMLFLNNENNNPRGIEIDSLGEYPDFVLMYEGGQK